MESNKERLFYIDHLRLLIIILVVIMHLAVTYSGFGSWYYMEGRPIGLISSILFGFYQSFTQGYFMGFLFLISGFFVPQAFAKKGFGGFIKGRLTRLGIPTLFYMLVINPFILYVQLDLNWLRPKPGFFSFYFDYVINFNFVSGSGPLWFALALLIFSMIYALIRLLFTRLSSGRPSTSMPQKQRSLTGNAVLLILIISLVAFLIRLVQPIGTSIINMQLSFFSQYIILFITGIYVQRHHLLGSLSWQAGKRWLLSALVLGFVVWAAIMVLGGALDGNENYNGGWSWQAAAFALWESFVAVAMAIGLIALFREKFNRRNKLSKILTDSSFTVYVFHAPIIIAAAQWLHPLDLLPIIKFAILCLLCIPACFLFSHFIIRKIPYLNKVL